MGSEELNNVAPKEERSTTNESQDTNNSRREDEEEHSEPIYIKVAEDENDEAVELPCERDNSILLSTLTSQFPGKFDLCCFAICYDSIVCHSKDDSYNKLYAVQLGASGLKYRNTDTNAMRGLRLSDGRFLAPEKGGWDAFSPYYCVFPRGTVSSIDSFFFCYFSNRILFLWTDFKRKLDDDGEKSKKTATSKSKCSDLIVLGLPWKITEEELKEYFEQFGETVMIQIKKDPKSGQSKGFGFVKFADYDIQMRVVAKRHNIFGRWCDVRIPLSKGEEQFSYQSSEFNRKIFVGRITEDFTCDDLRSYFKKFGEISDVFIPKPFRAFAFITFKDSETAQTLCGEDHLIKNVSVHVSNAVPKVDFNASGYHHSNHHHSNNHYGNHSYGNHHQSNYSHHNQSRYNPYKGGQQDMRRHQRNHQFNNQANNSIHSNPLVNSTYNPHPMAAPMPPNPIWNSTLGAHVSNGAPMTAVPNQPQYGMNPLTPKHYGQH